MTNNIDNFRASITWVADALIPSDPKFGMPSATEAGVPERLLPRALKERDDLAPAFFSALSRLPEAKPSDALGAIRALGADDFHTISFLIAGAYLLDEAINSKLRYPGQEAVIETPDYDEIMEVIERVQSRGSIYLDVPDSPK